MDVEHADAATLHPAKLDDARVGLQNLGAESVGISSDQRPVAHRQCCRFLFARRRDLQNHNTPQSRSRDSNRRYVRGSNFCDTSAARRIGGVDHRAPRRIVGIVLPAGDPCLHSRLSTGTPHLAQVLLALSRELRCGAAIQRDRRNVARALAASRHLPAAQAPSHTAPLAGGASSRGVVREDSFLRTQPGHDRGCAVQVDAYGSFRRNGWYGPPFPNCGRNIQPGVLSREDRSAGSFVATVRIYAAQNRSGGSTLPDQPPRSPVNYGNGDSTAPKIPLPSCCVACICDNAVASARLFRQRSNGNLRSQYLSGLPRLGASRWSVNGVVVAEDAGHTLAGSCGRYSSQIGRAHV